MSEWWYMKRRLLLSNKKISRNYSKRNAVSMIKLPLNLSITFYV